MNIESLYQEIIIDHSKQKHGYTSEKIALETKFNQKVTIADQAYDNCTLTSSNQISQSCGDNITVQIAIKDNQIMRYQWTGVGCAICTASSSLLQDLIVDFTISDFETLMRDFRTAMQSRGEIALNPEVFFDAAALSGVSKFIARIKCAMLAWLAVEDAISKTKL